MPCYHNCQDTIKTEFKLEEGTETLTEVARTYVDRLQGTVGPTVNRPFQPSQTVNTDKCATL
jgi:hypothetical protein